MGNLAASHPLLACGCSSGIQGYLSSAPACFWLWCLAHPAISFRTELSGVACAPCGRRTHLEWVRAVTPFILVPRLPGAQCTGWGTPSQGLSLQQLLFPVVTSRLQHLGCISCSTVLSIPAASPRTTVAFCWTTGKREGGKRGILLSPSPCRATHPSS